MKKITVPKRTSRNKIYATILEQGRLPRPCSSWAEDIRGPTAQEPEACTRVFLTKEVVGVALTPKQKRFVAEYLVDLNATAAATEREYRDKLKEINFWNQQYFAVEKFKCVDDPEDTIVSAYAILLSDTAEWWRKKAAYLLLRAFVRYDFLEFILRDDVAPFDRSDKRVMAWTKAVKRCGVCRLCGSTKGLEAHHMLSWSENPAGRIDIKNGMCLCARCHAKQHEGEPAKKLILSKAGRERGC